MATCVSISCPFIPMCRSYNNNVDRSAGCATQRDIVNRSKSLIDADEFKQSFGIDPRSMGGTYVWMLHKDGEIEPFRVFSVKWLDAKTAHLNCESTYTGFSRAITIGKKTLGRSVFLSEKDAVARKREIFAEDGKPPRTGNETTILWEDLSAEERKLALEQYICIREREEGRARDETNNDYPVPIDGSYVECCTFVRMPNGGIEVVI